MTTERIRTLWKKARPFVFAGIALSAVGVAAEKYFASDCCAPGAACCYPGSPCCHGKHVEGIAQR